MTFVGSLPSTGIGVHHKDQPLHGKINPNKMTGRYCPLVMFRVSPIFRVVSGDYGKPF